MLCKIDVSPARAVDVAACKIRSTPFAVIGNGADIAVAQTVIRYPTTIIASQMQLRLTLNCRWAPDETGSSRLRRLLQQCASFPCADNGDLSRFPCGARFGSRRASFWYVGSTRTASGN
jgi:hypothetical protein